MTKNPPPLILASSSRVRRAMLEAAGVACRVFAADVDEDEVRQNLGTHDHHGGPERMASALARAKAEDVSRRHPHALVIGADQILALGPEVFTKPAGLTGARDCLLRLSGQTHCLHAAVSLAHAGNEVWCHLGTAAMAMRQLSVGFIDDYLTRAGERVCASVGAYEIEGLGIQLFDRIDGDYFTILGMPLLPLLAELRARGLLST